MAFELREGQGSLFRNDKKASDKHPDWRGDALVNGVKMEVAAWEKQGRNGTFYSLSIKPKQERQDDKPQGGPAPARTYDKDRISTGFAPQAPREVKDALDDEIPF